MVRGLGWRWAVVGGGLSLLLAGPAAVQALPVTDARIDAATLLGRVQRSDAVAWSGYGESRGDLVLPDAAQLGDLPGLISGTTRLRAWWLGRRHHRVDALTLVGEQDVFVDGASSWTWSSADREAVHVQGELGVRLPRGGDLLAPALGARLARSKQVRAPRLPSRRVAGVDAAGLRLTPGNPRTTTVSRVDLWAESRTGLALRVELHAQGSDGAALTSLLLDVDLRPPATRLLKFRPPPLARVEETDAPDLAAAADRFAPFALPNTLAGLPRRDRVTDLGQGVATYGDGFTALTLVPLERRTARSLLRSLHRDEDPPDMASFSTVLLQGRVARVGDRGYLLAGTVPQDLLSSAIAQLRVNPPPVRER